MTNPDPRFSIGALAKRAGVNIETIRYYERIGLLTPPARTAGGYRMYREVDAGRLTFLRRARELGFSLDEIRALLSLADRRIGSCAEAHRLGEAHLDAVRGKIADLRRMERVLAQLVSACAGGTLPHCPLIDTLLRRAASAMGHRT
jgi:MerR family mercuric resistance operon transcriptional regulator